MPAACKAKRVFIQQLSRRLAFSGTGHAVLWVIGNSVGTKRAGAVRNPDSSHYVFTRLYVLCLRLLCGTKR